MASPSVVCVIPARYGSTRLEGKPLVEVGGKALVMWVYDAATRSGAFDDVVVATDDERIRETVEEGGGRAVMTSADHERGSDRVYETVRDASYSYVVNLQGDEPQVPPALLRRFVDELRRKVDDNAVLTCVSSGRRAEIDDPASVKVVVDGEGRALYFSRAPIPYDHGATDTFTRHTGIYGFTLRGLARYCAFGPGRLERVEKLEQLRALENGMVIHCLPHGYAMRSIDTPADLAAFRASHSHRQGPQ